MYSRAIIPSYSVIYAYILVMHSASTVYKNSKLVQSTFSIYSITNAGVYYIIHECMNILYGYC